MENKNMITFTYEHEESAHGVTFTLAEDSTATDVVASFSAFMLAASYSQETIDGAFAEMVVLDTVINPPPPIAHPSYAMKLEEQRLALQQAHLGGWKRHLGAG